MRIITSQSDQPVDLDKVDPMAQGGEGEIYELDHETVAKIYYKDQLTRHRQEKVLALSGKYQFYCGFFDETRFAFPRGPAEDADSRQLLGFEMRFLGKHPELVDIAYDLQNNQFRPHNGFALDDNRAMSIIYDLFSSLDAFHRARIILGDINASNILYNFSTGRPIFIDLDAAHIEKYGCVAYKQEYIDPQVEKMGKNSDGTLKYSCEGDQFAMSIIAYELFVGVHPFYLRCTPNYGDAENKRRGIGLLGYHSDNNYLSSRGVTIFQHPVNDAILSRLNQLKQVDHRLYQYLLDTLINGNRENLILRLEKTDPRHPAYALHTQKKGVRTIMDILKDGWKEKNQPLIIKPVKPLSIFDDKDVEVINKELGKSGQAHTAFILKKEAEKTNDPPAFKKFVENLGIDYGRIIHGGVS
jgi:serine/threonine protein kinase